MEEKILYQEKVVLRHSPIELTEHWLMAISGLVLLFSGFGELPMYKRYMVTQIPGLSWAGDFFINLKIHYLAAIVFLSVMVFHALYHGMLKHQGLLPKKGDVKNSTLTILSMLGFGKEPKADKYLPEQRLAYAYLGGIGLILVITGLVKVVKNLPTVYLPPGVITGATLIHTFGTIFFLAGVLAHLAALIFKVNRPMVKPIFTGKMNLDYVQRRHPLWYERLEKRSLVEVSGAGESLLPAQEAGIDKEQEKEEKQEITPQPETAGSSDPAGGKAEEKEGAEMVTTLKVKGMSCQHCVMAVTKALSQLDGIQNIAINLAKGEVSFQNSKGAAADRIKEAIEKAGYRVVPE